MNKVAPFLIVCALIFLAPAAQAKLEVVATTPDFGSIATEIGGSRASVTTLAKPTEDPHFVDAKPSFIVKLNRADAVVEGGAELEIGWLPALLDQSRNARLAPGAPGRISCSHGISLGDIPATLDRSRGDIHAAGNPHYMTDPLNAKIVAEHIANAFCQLDPKSCDTYRANLKKFTAELESKTAEWEKILAPFKGQRVVAYHDTWPYFARRFRLDIVDVIEVKEGVAPSPARLAKLAAIIREQKVRAILHEPFEPDDASQLLARRTGAVVLKLASTVGSLPQTSDYFALFDYNVATLARALSAASN